MGRFGRLGGCLRLVKHDLTEPDHDPAMVVLAVYGLRGSGEHRIGEAADGDRNGRGLSRRIPEDRGATRSAEVERDRESAIRTASVGPGSPDDLGRSGLKEGRNPEGASGAPLTLQAMAKRNLGEFRSAADLELAAFAASYSLRHRSSPVTEKKPWQQPSTAVSGPPRALLAGHLAGLTAIPNPVSINHGPNLEN
jgi:hypothetical protein